MVGLGPAHSVRGALAHDENHHGFGAIESATPRYSSPRQVLGKPLDAGEVIAEMDDMIGHA